MSDKRDTLKREYEQATQAAWDAYKTEHRAELLSYPTWLENKVLELQALLSDTPRPDDGRTGGGG